MSLESDLRQVARLAGTAADMAGQGQRATLSMLLSEMQALAAVMPGWAGRGEGADAFGREARHRADEERVEASFDNMPV